MELGVDVKASLTICIQTNNLKEYINLLETTKIHLTELQEPNGYTIFHEIALGKGKELYLLKFLAVTLNEFDARYTSQSKFLVKKMINTCTVPENQTPLGISICNNRKNLVKKYIELGSSLDILNKYSQGPVHLAAFYGLESIIVYLCKNLGLSTNDKDFSLRTPLHLAALEGRTNAAILLISLYENVNIVDAEGFTPLHLAVISQNYKIVRNLLIKNAKTDIKDLKGETPLTIAKNHEDASIIKLIVSINQEAQSSKRICDIYSKKISYEPNSYKKNLFYIFLFLLRAVIASCVLYNKIDLTLWVSSTGVLTLAFLFFIVSCIKNPGYAAIDKSENLLGLYEKYRGEFVCPYCECKKPSLARHCHACQRCVIECYHHCPWINNCIGKGNKIYYFLFLIFSLVDYGFQGFLAGFDYFHHLLDTNTIPIDYRKDLIYSEFGIMSLNLLGLVLILPVFIAYIKKNFCSQAKKLGKVSCKSLDTDVDTYSVLSHCNDEIRVQSSVDKPNFLLQNFFDETYEGAWCCSVRKKSSY